MVVRFRNSGDAASEGSLAAVRQHSNDGAVLPPRRHGAPAARRRAGRGAARALHEAVLGHSIFADQNQTAGYTFTTQAVCPLLAGRSVAVVGNGPLNKRQRGQINAADVILRFNALNNWQAGDRTDIWVIRHQPAPHDDVGFSLPLGRWAAAPGCLPRVAAVAQATQQFWLMLFQGWEEHTRVRLRKLAPYLNTTSGDARLLRAWAIDQSVAYQEAVQQALSIDSMVLPTTGLIGLLAVTQCNASRIDLWGTNWFDPWEGHQMGVEQELVEELQRRGRVKVHRTPCLKYRHCGQSEEQHATGVCDPDTLLPAAPPPPPLPAPA